MGSFPHKAERIVVELSLSCVADFSLLWKNYHIYRSDSVKYSLASCRRSLPVGQLWRATAEAGWLLCKAMFSGWLLYRAVLVGCCVGLQELADWPAAMWCFAVWSCVRWLAAVSGFAVL